MTDRQTHFWPPAGYTELRHELPTMLVCFGGSFDSFLRRVDQHMIEEAWREASRVVAELGLDSHECRWGRAHAGVWSVAAPSRIDTPLDGFGWLLGPAAVDQLGLSSAPGEEFWSLLKSIDAVFAACDPPLMAAYSHYRCYEWLDGDQQPIDPGDARVGMEVLFATLLGDIVSWRPRVDAGTGPWADIARALLHRDELLYHAAVAETFDQYTKVGAEIVARGYGSFLMSWSGYEPGDT